MTTYKPRELAQPVAQALRQMPAVAVTGMRQTGKTTLLREDSRFKDRRYITFDDFAQLEAAKENPEALLAGKDPLTIDEAQKCPELFPTLKKEIDRDRRPGRFLLSGSANFLLLRNLSESLAGRAVYFNLHPLDRREIGGQTDRAPFIHTFFSALPPSSSQGPAAPSIPRGPFAAVGSDEILRGGMPPVCLAPDADPALWFRGFEQTYLERDVRSLAQVADLIVFRRLMQMAALRTGQILKQSEIGRDAGLNSMTAGRYLDLLETSFAITRLAPFLKNKASRLIKSPKLFFTDPGLAAYLAGVKDLGPTADEPLRGALFETYACQNLAAILSGHWPGARLHFWSVQGRHEVDFVIEEGHDSIAIEVKAATKWGPSDLAPLEIFLDQTKGCRAGILAHNGTESVHLRGRLWALPLALVLS